MKLSGILFLIPLLGCAGPEPELHLPPDGVILSLTTVENGWLMVRATLPDGSPLNLMIDSGAPCSFFAARDVKGLDLPVGRPCCVAPLCMSHNSDWHPGTTRIDHLYLGEAEISGLQGTFSDIMENRSVLGMDVLKQCVFLIDQPGKTLHLLPRGDIKDRLKKRYPNLRWEGLFMPKPRIDRPVVNLSVKDGRSFNMLVDTGSAQTILQKKTVKALGLPPATIEEVLECKETILKKIEKAACMDKSSSGKKGPTAEPFRLKGLQIAGEERDLVVFQTDIFFLNHLVSYGLLGTDQLGQTPFAVDAQGHMLWIGVKPQP